MNSLPPHNEAGHHDFATSLVTTTLPQPCWTTTSLQPVRYGLFPMALHDAFGRARANDVLYACPKPLVPFVLHACPKPLVLVHLRPCFRAIRLPYTPRPFRAARLP